MKKSAQSKYAMQSRRELRQTLATLAVVLVLTIVVVLSFLRFYNAYIDETLYAERLNQMREVTTQLFSGLEDVVKNQWRMVDEQNRVLQKSPPDSLDDFTELMQEQVYISDLDSVQCQLLAVDENGFYYTQNGKQGLLTEREYLLERPEQISYVSNSLISGETRMVFLKQLEEPIIVRDGDQAVKISYYGVSENMEELNPYFECSAYSGNSSVYVVDRDGLKLFSSSSSSTGDLLKGYNVYSVLQSMDYLHGSAFDSARQELEDDGLSYSNAVLDGTELYYALYKMENSEWTLVFLVPSSYVAMNTVQLINMTIRLVLIFVSTLMAVSVLAILWLTKRQQKAALEAERRNNEMLEQVNEELSRTAKEAERANRAKSDFLANMSHDIRTPMNAIVGITSLMEHEEGTSDKLHTYIEKVQLSSRHLLSLINDVLDMSKIESSEVAINQNSVSLAEQVGQVDSIIRSQATERGQDFQILVHNISHEYVISDEVRLRQIFLNLLSNAVKYTPYGGRVRFDITEETAEKSGGASQRPEKAQFLITVTDNGCGMTPEFMEHIFEPFTRAENSMTNKVQGTGLGMAITKNIVDLMGGTISVQSEVGKGSCFEVKLAFPIDYQKEKEVLPNVQEVLLVSDDALLCTNVQASLQEAEVAFEAAVNEHEACHLLQKSHPDVILVNGYLDRPDLAELVQTLRKQAKNAVLLFCCEYAQPEQVHELVKKSGVDGLVARPFFFSNLVHEVNRVQGKASEEDEEGSSLKGMRFLCAEDNELNAEILKAILEMNGASCTMYPDGQQMVQAFSSVKEGDYDAILMDVQMPVMNGLEATRRIRSGENPLGATIPIIAMTANAFAEDVQECMDAGMNAHVSKPLDIRALERALRGGFTPPVCLRRRGY